MRRCGAEAEERGKWRNGEIEVVEGMRRGKGSEEERIGCQRLGLEYMCRCSRTEKTLSRAFRY